MRPVAARGPGLRETLTYTPVELAFGTSGLRGLVSDLSQLEAYVATRGFLAFLRRRRLLRGDGEVCCAGDLRPSTDRLVPEQGGRGELLQAVLRAVEDAGCRPFYAGRVPSPALMAHAVRRGAASVMVTGSHIPFDRNGIKYNTPTGEVLKRDEAPILAEVAAARTREYARPAAESLFDARGMFRPEHRQPLPPEDPRAREEYLRRYLDAFPAGLLAGRRLLAYQHSAVGRDLLVEVLRGLGAEVLPAGRSDAFVPIDTEAVEAGMLAGVQALVDSADAPLDAVVSTDGDGDRPLLLAVVEGRVRFLPGDLLGLVAADFLGARAVTVPVSSTDAIELFFRPRGVEPRRTRIGSPYVIEALEEVGWEANGGFLTARKVRIPGGGALEPLPSRDALLPLLCVLAASLGRGRTLAELFDHLPPRFSSSQVLRPFPRERYQNLAGPFTPMRSRVTQVRYAQGGARVAVSTGGRLRRPGPGRRAAELEHIRERLQGCFRATAGFAPVAWIHWLDGLRIGFADGDIVHLRPSGNAPELRLYVVAGNPERAAEVSARVTGGALAEMERWAGQARAIEAFAARPRPLLLRGKVQHYAWGGTRFLPELLGLPDLDDRPWAELWLGAHPKASAEARLEEEPETWLPLDRLLREAPETVLGRSVARRFDGQLPYLLKVLEAREMLSIQVHPSRPQARAGFARENAAGLPPDSPERSYLDPNSKPEVHAAVSEMWLLHGFRPPAEIAAALRRVPELERAFPDFADRLAAHRGPAAAPLRELFTRLMTLPQPAVDAILGPLLARLEREAPSDPAHPDFWALRAAPQHPLPGGGRDRGILAIYLLNLVHLQPGQGTFQPAGLPHAYLEGTTVELMSCSDNVLRGGLTPKKINVPELLRALRFQGKKPRILEAVPTSPAEHVLPARAREFRLSRIELSPSRSHRCRRHGPDCLLALQGEAVLRAASAELKVERGAAVLVPAGLPYLLEAGAGEAVLYRASVP